MEEVLAALRGARVSEGGGGGGGYEYQHMYKNQGRDTQPARRRRLLAQQRRWRNDQQDRKRGILELVEAVQMEIEWSTINENKARYIPSTHVPGFRHKAPSYKDTLMLSEWLVEKPEDLYDNWYLVPCPKGTRVLFVANQGKTKFFSKYGKFLFEGHTGLPGGNLSGRYRSQCSVLDGIWYEKTSTVYVLDLLAWNNQPMTDCDTDFRQYWLSSQLEDGKLQIVNKQNHFKMIMLPKIPCTPENLNEAMMKCPMLGTMTPSLDGLLFYHKQAHYMSGSTPLVGWLYPYMVNEILGEEITVNPLYTKAKPPNYTTQAEFIVKFEAKHNKLKKSRARLDSTTVMSVTDDTSNSAPTAVEMEEVTSGTNLPDNTASITQGEVRSAIFNTSLQEAAFCIQ